MKKTTKSNGILVENETIDRAGLGDKVKLVATDHLITLMKSNMTAMDLIKTIDATILQLEQLINSLAESCGECEDCGHCEELEGEILHLPDYLLEIAGIPKDAKLCAYVEEDTGVVHVEQAEHEHDLTDVPPYLRSLLGEYGICMGELDAMLIKGEEIHG